MDRPVLDRRTLLRLLGSLLLVGTGGDACRREDPMARAAERDVTRAIFRDRASAVAVGREYLRARPDEADTKQLLDQLGLGSLGLGGLSDDERETLLSQLHARHRKDFRSNRVVDVGGWTLSLTEARLSALASLVK